MGVAAFWRRLVWLAEGRLVKRFKKDAGKGNKDLHGVLFRK